MLKKLKIKFVIVIMSVVTVIFAAVFSFVMHYTRRNAETESIQMMRQMSHWQKPPLPEEKPGNIRLPYFTVIVRNDRNVEVFGDAYYNINDKALLDELLNEVYSRNRQTGLISEYDLRYLITVTGDAESIVFADISSEKAMLSGLMRNCIIIGLIGYAVFFVISFVLANWVTKPVEKTWNEQKRFIADTSHELKTPLTVIMTNAEMLQDDNYSENEKTGFGKNILAMSKRMRGLVESLLELARMDAGSVAAVYETLDFSKLVSDGTLPFEPLFYEKGMEIVCDIDNGIRVNGDKTSLEQVISILLDNALKYSSSEKPVAVTLKRRGKHAVLSVSGGGEHISKENRQNIFKRFFRIDKARNDGQSYGLGLPIADGIVTGHGGHIRVESKGGRNTFYVTLPEKR